MTNEEVMAILLLIGVGIGLFSSVLINNIRINWEKLKTIHQNNKKFAALQKNVDDMRAKGELHEWQEIMTMQGKMLVCAKTGWCPTLKGFLPLQVIQQQLEHAKAEEEYKEFRAARIQLIAHERNMTTAEVERLVEQIFTMKKDFYVQRVAKLQQEMEAKAAAVLNEQGKN